MTVAAKRKPVVLPRLAIKSSPNQSPRRGPVHLVVVHRPVGSYAGSIAQLMNPAPGGNPDAAASAHVIMAPGGKNATQLVPWDRKAWACKAFNSLSDNLEIADEAWTGEDREGFKVAARIVAFRCHQRGIPPVWTREPLVRPGVIRHYDLGLAGGGHEDPTKDLDVWRAFMALVKAEVRRGGFRRQWGVGDDL